MFSLPLAPPVIGSSSWNKTEWKEGHGSEDEDQEQARDKRVLKTSFVHPHINESVLEEEETFTCTHMH